MKLPSVVLLAAVLLALLGPELAGMLGLDASRSLAAPFATSSDGLPFGTDHLGRDVLAGVLAGGARLIALALAATVVTELVGVALGLTLTFGRTAPLLQALLDLLLLLPAVVVSLVVVTALGSTGLVVVLLVAVLSAPFTARLVRSTAVRVLGSGFVEVARAVGDGPGRVLLAEVVPNLRPVVLADAGLRLVTSMYLVATVGFLGVGAGIGGWAAMVSDNLAGVTLNPFAVLAPVVAIAAVTVPANLLADRWGQR